MQNECDCMQCTKEYSILGYNCSKHHSASHHISQHQKNTNNAVFSSCFYFHSIYIRCSNTYTKQRAIDAFYPICESDSKSNRMAFNNRVKRMRKREPKSWPNRNGTTRKSGRMSFDTIHTESVCCCIRVCIFVLNIGPRYTRVPNKKSKSLFLPQ